MASLTEGDVAQVVKLQREAGVQQLSRHFSWPEFCDERRCFHQDFVYDFVMFAVDCGFSWPDVIQAAVIAKDIFPQLDAGLDVPKLFSLLLDVLSDCLPNLTSVHRHEFTKFLTDTCTSRRRLLQAVVGGAANISITQLHLEVQLPPTPCPLAEGTDVHEWEHRRHQSELTSMLQQKEEELKVLRDGSRVTLGEVDVPEELDKEGVSAAVRAAVRATEGQIVASLTQEASLLNDIQQLKLQQAALATGGPPNTVASNTAQQDPHVDAPAKSKPRTAKAKTKTGLRESGNAT